MRKVLLGSTALAGVSLLCAGAAYAAEPPTVSVGGFVDFQAGIADQDDERGTGGVDLNGDDDAEDEELGEVPGSGLRGRTAEFVNDTEIFITVAGRADNGLGYGASIEVENGVEDDFGNDIDYDETVLFLEGAFGRLEFGDEDGSDDRMFLGPEVFAAGAGGIDGDFDRFLSLNTTAMTFPDIRDTGDATKITYYTPRVSGFQVGVSYTHDATSEGLDVDPEDDGPLEYHVGGGLNYVGTLGPVGLGLAVVGAWADAEDEDFAFGNIGDDFWGAAVGGTLTFAGVNFGASGGFDSLSGEVAADAGDRWFASAGIGYAFGPVVTSITALYSENQDTDDEFLNTALGVTYALAPGLNLYGDLHYVDLDGTLPVVDDDDDTVDNEAVLGILGVLLNF